MKNIISCVSVLIGLCVSSIAYSADYDNRKALLNTDFDKIIEEIKNTPAKTIETITGDRPYVVKRQIIKANTIVFSDASILEFSNIRFPYIAIVAQEIILKSPNYSATIKRADIETRIGDIGIEPSPSKRPPKQPKAPRPHTGHNGAPGIDGGAGGAGETLHLPQVLVFADKISKQAGGPSGPIQFQFIFKGIDGGKGGKGGKGGQGGEGGDGGPAYDKAGGLGGCGGGPGNGGHGGYGGMGGKGGDGGNPGNGADVFYVGSAQARFALRPSDVYQRGGVGGLPGGPGILGDMGAGGARGERSRSCRGGSGGTPRIRPDPKNHGVGKDKSKMDGRRGVTSEVDYDVTQLFK